MRELQVIKNQEKRGKTETGKRKKERTREEVTSGHQEKRNKTPLSTQKAKKEDKRQGEENREPFIKH